MLDGNFTDVLIKISRSIGDSLDKNKYLNAERSRVNVEAEPRTHCCGGKGWQRGVGENIF